MARLRVEYEVVMEDPEERVFVIVTDQRDFAALEAREDITKLGFHTQGRFMVWNAMRRQKLTGASWENFNSDLCASVAPKSDGVDADDEGEDEESLDPGQKAVSGGS